MISQDPIVYRAIRPWLVFRRIYSYALLPSSLKEIFLYHTTSNSLASGRGRTCARSLIRDGWDSQRPRFDTAMGEGEKDGTARELTVDATPAITSNESSSTENAPTVAPGGKDFDTFGDDVGFDHGWRAWSQVVASFVLFFNTWYVRGVLLFTKIIHACCVQKLPCHLLTNLIFKYI